MWEGSSLKRTIKIAVRDFAQPLRRHGSLRRDGGFAALEFGVDIHERLQAEFSKVPGFCAEVQLAARLRCKSWTIHVSGRADGIYEGPEPVIEEIKSAFSLSRIEDEISQDPEHPYILQVKTYAWLYWRQSGVLPRCRLLLVSLRGRGRRKVEITLDPDQFSAYVEARLAQLVELEKERERRRQRRRAAAAGLTFPFAAMRPHQDELIAAVNKACTDGGRLMVQAPTGIGKTMGVLYPALQESLSRGAPLVYVTPKNSQFAVVEESLRQLRASGAKIKYAVLTAKSKLCLKDEVRCDPQYCEYARDYYDKIEDLDLRRKLMRQRWINGAILRKTGRNHEVCPWEAGFEALEAADVIVCDYNYVFSPTASLAGMIQAATGKQKFNLIIDEAHNLYQRAMEYYSPEISMAWLHQLLALEMPESIRAEWTDLVQSLQHFMDSCRPQRVQSAEIEIDQDGVTELLAQITAFLFRYFEVSESLADDDPVIRLYIDWGTFAQVLQDAGDESRTCWVLRGNDELLKIICCSPARYLAAAFEHFHSVTAFSATLKPFEFYRDVTGFAADTPTMEFASGFPPENRKILVIPQVSTTFRERGHWYARIAEAIRRLTSIQPGHYLVFFPSYDFLVRTAAGLADAGLNLVVQEANAPAREIRRISALLMEEGDPLVVLAVQGGPLSEGVDINSEALKGAIVVGPALPRLCFEQEMLRAYFEMKFGDGFAYAYAWPAMARSIQAAGRVIRSETKRGLIVLMDRRFTDPTYVQAMPRDWFRESVHELVSTSITATVRDFWAAGGGKCEEVVHPVADGRDEHRVFSTVSNPV